MTVPHVVVRVRCEEDRGVVVRGVATWVLHSDGDVSEVMGDPTVQCRVLGEGV